MSDSNSGSKTPYMYETQTSCMVPYGMYESKRSTRDADWIADFVRIAFPVGG
ncbi:predicted protein [Plenodomus lingam JN3]|uniref:Predicted protein n=1 Tax=Leptosphaeria maculans (strain JN3 / isolate v23.1.3 / race Av1-4-5-6-7-8) TaxID=985895 RepID=E4ZN85_LEPMJ|nr:predicted protein [Plenodomus lingam JN3]CBX92944.1 predicted protein [Plenodomus lingam JN3]